MTGRIIHMPGDHHRQIQSLLPWYRIGSLDEDETVQVADHLGQCAECQAELSGEDRLWAQIADLPIGADAPDVEHGWAAISRQIAQERPRPSPLRTWVARLTGGAARRDGAWLHWALAGQACLVLILCGALWSIQQPARYHALGSAPASTAANLIVIFRPETPEKDLRLILRANDARLVDGPTVADAYLLHVPEAGRSTVLAQLRRQPQVVLVEPVDRGEPMKTLVLRRAAMGLAMLAACVGLTSAKAVPAPPHEPLQPGRQVLVMLRMPPQHFRPGSDYGGGYGDGEGRSARDRIARRLAHEHGISLVDEWPMPLLGVDCYVMTVPADQTAEAFAAGLSRSPGVSWSEPLHTYRGQGRAEAEPAGHDDPLYLAQPAAREWRLAALHKVSTGRNVRVAVIDSQIDKAHPDLAGQVEVSENFVPNRPATPEDHGTGVAGVIAARADNGVGIAGVAPQARLMALRACWQEKGNAGTVCDSLTLAKALDFAINHNAQVINMSLSGPPDLLLGKLLDVALARDMAVVSAYDRNLPGGGFPASHSGVVAVVDEQSGPSIAGVFSAPGRDVPTTQPGGRWFLVNGSSYAAAHVSGLLALLRQRRPFEHGAVMLVAAHPGDGIDACATLMQRTEPCRCCGAPELLTTAAK